MKNKKNAQITIFFLLDTIFYQCNIDAKKLSHTFILCGNFYRTLCMKLEFFTEF